MTKHHFPDVVQLGDITKLDGVRLWPVDIICAGSPCQDLSVAGKQEGLKGERSGLFRDAIRLVRDMRRASGGQAPRFFVWENVPGAFSSNKGLDFRAVLEEITETEIPMPENNKWADAGLVEWDGGSLAWRVLDAQYWGVPQRRRRIFLVADFTGHSAGEILFEREGLRGDSSESRATGEGTAAGVESRVGGASVVRMRAGCAGGGKGALVSRERSLTLAANTNDQVLFVPDKARSLTARNDGSPCVDRGPDVVAVYDMTHADEVMRKVPDGRAPTLNTVDRHAVYAMQRSDKFQESQVAHTLAARDYKSFTDLVAIPKTVGALCADDHKGTNRQYVEQGKCVIQKSVRRITPTECERLMGLEDGYTLIDDKTCSDTARYKALGNGMAMPCANYVIRRIVEVCDAT